MKTCYGCGLTKCVNEFGKRKASHDGLQSRCINCMKKYRQNNLDKYRKKERERYRKKVGPPKPKMSQEKRDERQRQRSKEYYHQIVKNDHERYAKELERQRQNRDQSKRREYFREYKRRKRQDDIQARLAENLRSRLNIAITHNQKAGSAVTDLGCSVLELKTHLENQFEEGMTWDNWSLDGWHIDHIKPLHIFDLTDREQFLEACHYTNLRPMWSYDNLSRSYDEFAEIAQKSYELSESGV